MKTYKRGEVAKITGLGFEGIRFYEKEGLIPKPDRSKAGYRIYTEEMIELIKFYQHARKIGFTLNETKELLDLNPQCEDISKTVQKKIEDIHNKIASLNKVANALTTLVTECDAKKPFESCRIIALIEGAK